MTNSTRTAEIALLVGAVITTLELSRSEHDVAYKIRHGLSLKKEDLIQ